MDISNFDLAASGSATMQLRNPSTGERLTADDGKPITIELLGRDAPEYRRKMASTANTRIKGKKFNQSLEAMEQDGINLLASITVGWSGIVENGEKVKHSEEAARRLYKQYAWIREQVDEYVNDRSNFLTSA